MKSVIQSEKECFLCGITRELHCHHVFGGVGNRKMSERYGMKVWLCREHHTGNAGVHQNRDLDLIVKEVAQTNFEKKVGSREEFMKIFGRNYL